MSYSDFYIVSATIIPVFFLALTLQGKQFDDAEHLMRKLNQSIKEHLDQIGFSKPNWRAFSKFALSLITLTVIRIVTLALVVFSVLGEVFAILPLYQGKADPGTRGLVLIAVLGLTIGVGLLLFVRLEILYGTTVFIMGRRYIRLIQEYIRLMRQTAPVAQPTDEDPQQQDPPDRHAEEIDRP